MQSYRQIWIPIVIFIIGMMLVPVRITGWDMSALPGDAGDNRFNNYILEHGHRYLTGADESFWTAPFMYPHRQNIALSDNLLGSLPFYSAFRFLGADREGAFQGWFMLLFVLNYFFSWYALRKMTGSTIGAALGAYIFTFSMPVIAQINHAQLLPRFAMPLCFLFLDGFLKSFSLKKYALFLFMLAWQFYCGMYMGFLLLLAVVIYALFASFDSVQWRAFFARNKMYFLWLTVVSALFIVIMLPLALPYMDVVREMGYRNFDNEIQPGMPRVASYFYAVSGSYCWGVLGNTGDYLPVPWEHRIFAGLLPWLSVVVLATAFFSRRARTAMLPGTRLVIFTIAALALLTLFVYGSTLYKLVLHIPGFGSMRVLTRVIFVLLFFLGFCMAVLYSRKIESQSRSGLLRILLIILVIGEQAVSDRAFVRISKTECQENVKMIMEKVEAKSADANKPFAYMPATVEDYNTLQIETMLAAQSLGRKTVNGYAASAPGCFGLFWSAPNDANLLQWLQEKQVADTSGILIVR